MSALNYARMPGFGDLPGNSRDPNSPDYDSSADERRAELIDSLLSDQKWVDAHKREAEEWVAGTFDGEHYTEVTLTLHALHHCDTAVLPGSPLLEALLRLAKVQADALDAKLREIAEAEADEHRRAA